MVCRSLASSRTSCLRIQETHPVHEKSGGSETSGLEVHITADIKNEFEPFSLGK